MGRIRVLWLSNRLFETIDEGKSGSWLTSLGSELALSDIIALGNISIGSSDIVRRCDFENINQWVVPSKKRNRNGLPPTSIVSGIQEAVASFSPDIIHIWGTEGYWGLLTSRGYIRCRSLLTIQGLIKSIVPVFYGGLTFSELLSCIGIREIIKPRGSLFSTMKYFRKRSIWEDEIISSHPNIMVQSEWINAYIKMRHPQATIYKTDRALRKEFLDAESWKIEDNLKSSRRTIFTISTGYPNKGLHVLIRSLQLVKNIFPDVKLNIGGYFLPSGIKQSGYERWIIRLISALGLSNEVNFLGPLTVNDVVKQLQSSSVFVNPSFVESYSVALLEALKIGTPCVVAFSGAMPELAINEHDALYFSPGDHYGCARQILRILEYPDVSQTLSLNARLNSYQRCRTSIVLHNQILTYLKVLDSPL